jgi:ketosteroid isomerase-like protein
LDSNVGHTRVLTPLATPNAPSGGYEHAVQRRASLKSVDTESRVAESAQRLRTAGEAYADSVRDITGETVDGRRILQDLQAYENAGALLVTFADDQRALAVEFLNRCATMDAFARDSIDDSWRVFGHVFARRSLIALSAQLEELRRSAQNLSGARGSDLDAVTDALVTMEAAVAATLSGDERELARTQGEKWTARMRGDLEWLSASGAKLQLMDVRQSVSLAAAAPRAPFASLLHYPLTRIRLDRPLTTDLDAATRMLTIARNLTGWATNLGLCVDPDGVEQLARRLHETHLCELRHYVRCNLPVDPAELVGAPEFSAISYESCIGFRESFVVKSTAHC